MNWAHTATAKALAALAERQTAADRTFASTPSNWNPHDVWMKRTAQPRDRSDQPPLLDPATPHRHASTPHD